MRLAVALLAAFALPSLAQAPPRQEPLKKGVNEIVIPSGKYWLEIPNDYDPKKPKPVICFMHGKTVDLKADNARSQLDNAFVLGMKKRGYIAMAPVMPPDHRPHWFENGESFDFLQAAFRDLHTRVNVQYIVCSGFSAGANYTIHYGQHRYYHEWFSAYLVMAGGGNIDTECPEPIKKKPIWLGCGDIDNDTYDDKLNTTGGARKTRDVLKESGFESFYDEFPKVGHTMDAKMVAKALEFVDTQTPTIIAIGADMRAGQIHEDEPGKALLLLEIAQATKGKVAEYWSKRVTEDANKLIEMGKQAVAAAAANPDEAKKKDELMKLGQAWVGTSIEKQVKEAMLKK